MSATTPRSNGRSRSRVAAAETEHVPTMIEALLAVQAEAPKLTRNAQGQVQNRTYGYTTLDAVLDAMVPLLDKHELLWRFKPTTGEDGKAALRYRITHVPTGDFDEDVVPLPMVREDPQAYGSSQTYMRRYTLQAYFNLAPGDDDDGAAASTTGETSAPSRETSAAAPKQSERPATAPQRKMLRAKAGAAKLANSAFANVLKAAGGDEPVQWSDEAAADRWLDRALERLPARLVDEVIAGIAHTAAEGSQA